MTTQTTMPEGRAGRPIPFTIDVGPSSTRRALVWTGVALGSLAVWASLILGAVLLFQGI